MASRNRKTRSSGRSGIPNRGDAVFATRSDGIDYIGLSISELYTLVDPALQSIVSADGGVTRRSDADIWALMLASPLLNTRTMVANSDNGGAIYRYDTSDGILFKVKRYFGVIEPFCAFGNVPFNTSDNNQVWVLT